MSIEFSFRYNSSSLRFDLTPWQFQNVMFRPMKLSNRYLPWMTVTYNGLSGGFRLLGDSLNGGLRWRDGFRSGWFCGDFGARVHLGARKSKGPRGAGALREPMDSNSSFPVILTPSIVFATVETLWHMLDFRLSMSCLGLG